jgi:hypothetical protein
VRETIGENREGITARAERETSVPERDGLRERRQMGEWQRDEWCCCIHNFIEKTTQNIINSPDTITNTDRERKLRSDIVMKSIPSRILPALRPNTNKS